MLEIDGGYLEGGGQILRIALSLSCLLKRAIRIVNIRANRPNPGLSNQHLHGLNLLLEITSAQVVGNELKSTVVEFMPQEIKAGNYTAQCRTAASVSLVLQSALPVLLFANGTSTLEIHGGTNVAMAPQIDFITEVLKPNLERFGVTFDFDLLQRGYYPRGGGKITVTIHPIKEISAFDMTKFGLLKQITGWSFVAGRLPLSLANEMKEAAKRELAVLNCSIDIEAYKEHKDMARDDGAGIILKAETNSGCVLGADALAGKRFDAQQLGKEAGAQLLRYILQANCVDEHVQDQLIIFMCLANGTSKIQTCVITDHTKTAMHVAKVITGAEFYVQSVEQNQFIIQCKGIGLNK